MQVLDIIPVSPKETFLIGYPSGPVQPGRWELRLNGEVLATLEITGEVQTENERKGKLPPPRVLVCRGPVDKRGLDFSKDDVTLERLE